MKTPPSVAIYEALTKNGYKIVNSRMAAVRIVDITCCIGQTHDGVSAYCLIKHSWESDETYDLEEIIQEIEKEIKKFNIKDKMDEALN